MTEQEALSAPVHDAAGAVRDEVMQMPADGDLRDQVIALCRLVQRLNSANAALIESVEKAHRRIATIERHPALVRP